MRIFLAGATGAIGRQLVPLLVAAGHDVCGLTRDPAKAVELPQAVIGSAYDADFLREAVAAFAPDLVMNQMTDLPASASEIGPTTNTRIRTEGHGNLLAAAGGARFMAQSIAFPASSPEGVAATAELEQTTLEAGGVVLRYAQFYGPGTYYPDSVPDEPRVQIKHAAARTVELLDAPSGVIVVTD